MSGASRHEGSELSAARLLFHAASIPLILLFIKPRRASASNLQATF
jgi:hypothetical protein